MDNNDPLLQFLKNTGWSPEDLLEKLQQFKSVQSNGDQGSSKLESKSNENEAQECIIDSTSDGNEDETQSVNEGNKNACKYTDTAEVVSSCQVVDLNIDDADNKNNAKNGDHQDGHIYNINIGEPAAENETSNEVVGGDKKIVPSCLEDGEKQICAKSVVEKNVVNDETLAQENVILTKKANVERDNNDSSNKFHAYRGIEETEISIKDDARTSSCDVKMYNILSKDDDKCESDDEEIILKPDGIVTEKKFKAVDSDENMKQLELNKKLPDDVIQHFELDTLEENHKEEDDSIKGKEEIDNDRVADSSNEADKTTRKDDSSSKIVEINLTATDNEKIKNLDETSVIGITTELSEILNSEQEIKTKRKSTIDVLKIQCSAEEKAEALVTDTVGERHADVHKTVRKNVVETDLDTDNNGKNINKEELSVIDVIVDRDNETDKTVIQSEIERKGENICEIIEIGRNEADTGKDIKEEISVLSITSGRTHETKRLGKTQPENSEICEVVEIDDSPNNEGNMETEVIPVDDSIAERNEMLKTVTENQMGDPSKHTCEVIESDLIVGNMKENMRNEETLVKDTTAEINNEAHKTLGINEIEDLEDKMKERENRDQDEITLSNETDKKISVEKSKTIADINESIETSSCDAQHSNKFVNDNANEVSGKIIGGALGDQDKLMNEGISITESKSFISSDDKSFKDDFSDTDEDERLVKVTNENVINEIIEDIFANEDKCNKEMCETFKEISGREEVVTEIEVIELSDNDEEEDDNFEDECIHANINTSGKIQNEITNAESTIIILSSSSSECSESVPIQDVLSELEINKQGLSTCTRPDHELPSVNVETIENTETQISQPKPEDNEKCQMESNCKQKIEQITSVDDNSKIDILNETKVTESEPQNCYLTNKTENRAPGQVSEMQTSANEYETGQVNEENENQKTVTVNKNMDSDYKILKNVDDIIEKKEILVDERHKSATNTESESNVQQNIDDTNGKECFDQSASSVVTAQFESSIQKHCKDTNNTAEIWIDNDNQSSVETQFESTIQQENNIIDAMLTKTIDELSADTEDEPKIEAIALVRDFTDKEEILVDKTNSLEVDIGFEINIAHDEIEKEVNLNDKINQSSINVLIDKSNQSSENTIEEKDNLLKTNKLSEEEESKICRDTVNNFDRREMLSDQNDHSSRDKDNSNDELEQDGFTENGAKENVEDIRNILKMQLNCLRTRKRGDFLPSLKTTIVNSSPISKKDLKDESSAAINFSELESAITACSNESKQGEIIEQEKHSFLSEPAMHDEIKERIEPNDQCFNTDVSDPPLEKSILYTQTNELGFVISDVQGGIELDDIGDDSFNKSSDEVNLEYTSNAVSLVQNDQIAFSNPSTSQTVVQENLEENGGVFAEIRKIIHKQKNAKTVLEENSKNTTTIDNFGFFKYAPGQSSEEVESIMNKNNSFASSAGNSQSSFNLDDSSQNVENNSPFVSNTLDEFLTESSKLNISYNVPKCGAEEGLKDNVRENDTLLEESPLVLKKTVILKEKSAVKKEKKNTKVKVKTLAQKRKLLEKQKTRDLKRLQKTIKAEKVKEEQEKRSYIMYEDKKIFVVTHPDVIGKCVASINSQRSTQLNFRSLLNTGKKKLSLLADEKKRFEGIKYSPGPLSKKSDLQLTGNSYWETETKKLPQILLDISPSIGKPIPPDILNRLPVCDGVISQSQIDFALSVLKEKSSTESKKMIFRYPLRYHNNQQQMFVRKRRLIVYKERENTDDTPKCDKNTVKEVIEDLLRYIEIKELAPSLIRQDDEVIKYEEKFCPKIPPLADDFGAIINKHSKKKRKVDHELLRLSCKVVNVALEEEEEGPCDKPFCQLGCICKSLKCENIISYHCQKPQCMFSCSCPKERPITYNHNFTFPAGTDVLSTEAVSRIEGEAKRNLAKVEREFTQTVIRTNDKTIVVGLGTRSKFRRSAKVPVKYTEFFEDDDKVEREKPIPKSIFNSKCFIDLPRLDLNGIVPYCLTHRFYECECKCKSIYVQPQTSESSHTKESLEEFSRENRKSATIVSEVLKKHSENKLKRKTSFASDKIKIQRRDKSLERQKDQDQSPNLTLEIGNGIEITNDCSDESVPNLGRPMRVIKKPSRLKDSYGLLKPKHTTKTSSGCARTRKIPSIYLKTHTPTTDNFKNDFIHNVLESDLLKAKIHIKNTNVKLLEADVLKYHLMKELMQENTKRKRKQIIEVRTEDGPSVATHSYSNIDGAMQRRKKPATGIMRPRHIKPVFEGEIILDESNMELLRKMGQKTVSEGYARLLPWMYLIKGFKENTICIWCMVNQPTKLLMNKTSINSTPPDNYVDIRNSRQTTQVILWICRNKLPPSYIEENVSFILKATKGNFEICGVCTKNGAQPMHDMIPSRLIASSQNETNFVHKDMNGTAQLLVLTKDKFKLQELIEESLEVVGDTSVDKSNLYMWAALPEISRICKWRMIFLNSDFTYLYFRNLKYTIKYTDLLSAGNIAKTNNCTVMLRNAEIQDYYPHKFFGIYFDPHYQDRLFVGPYIETSNDVETLRYFNQNLVCTESFNKMRGQGDYKCGHWLVERPYSSNDLSQPTEKMRHNRKRKTSSTTIDLTQDDEGNEENGGEKVATEGELGSINELNELLTNEVISFGDGQTQPLQILMHNGEKIRVVDGPPKKPEEFNRYLITNIPHFGYLGASQSSKSPEIDVQWPFENKLLRFTNSKCAVDFLQVRFSSLLISIPSTFKITVIVLTQIDLKNNQPINAGLLNGRYICGDFGCYNIMGLTEEWCIENLRMSKEQAMRMVFMKAQATVQERIKHLGSLLKIPKDTKDFVQIIDSAISEINRQKRLLMANAKYKNELIQKKRKYASKAFQLISELSLEDRQNESMKFWNTMRWNKSDPIEIQDSDEETEKKENKLAKGVKSSCSTSLATSNPVNKAVPMKSVLKPLISVPIDDGTSLLLRGEPSDPHSSTAIKAKTAHYIKGVKLIKSVSGKYMLVPDNKKHPQTSPSKLATGTRIVIRNNKIQSVFSKCFSDKPATITRISDSGKDCQVTELLSGREATSDGNKEKETTETPVVEIFENNPNTIEERLKADNGIIDVDKFVKNTNS